MQVTCEVEVDVDDILDDLDDSQLAEHGLMRVPPARSAESVWRDVQQALRQHDQRCLHDLLSDLAWKQGGVILPVGMPLFN
jgi:hypothetical protein